MSGTVPGAGPAALSPEGRWAGGLAYYVGLLHLLFGLGKLVGWSAVHRGTWAIAFLSPAQATFVSALGIAANIVLGVALVRNEAVVPAAVATVAMSTLSALCHGYVILAGELVAIGCGARIVAPVGSLYHYVMGGGALVLLSLSCVVLVRQSRSACLPDE
jgi:hypothetical protein